MNLTGKYNMRILDLQKETGYHYSREILKVGDTLISHQTNAKTYKLVWQLYKEIADELGVYYPDAFGYAYPMKKTGFTQKLYIVNAPIDYVTRGNFDYSTYVTMANLSNFMDRSITNFDERLENRNQLIIQQAKTYFTSITDINRVELISDQWRVVKIIDPH
jgi:hypothetical protein